MLLSTGYFHLSDMFFVCFEFLFFKSISHNVLKNNNSLGVVACTFNASKAGGFLWVLGHFGLHSDFQYSQGYIHRETVFKERNKERKGEKKERK